MTIEEITFCNNPRCILKCARKDWPRDLSRISMASFGPDNGDSVRKPEDCKMYCKQKDKGGE